MATQRLGFIAKQINSNSFIIISQNPQTKVFDQKIQIRGSKSQIEKIGIKLGNCIRFDIGNNSSLSNISKVEKSLLFKNDFEIIDSDLIIHNVVGLWFETNPFIVCTEYFGDVTFVGDLEELRKRLIDGNNVQIKLKMSNNTQLQDSVWMSDLEDLEKEIIEVVGLVFGANYVWTKKLFPSNRLGRLEFGKFEKVGTWITMRFRRQEYDNYFQNPTKQYNPCFIAYTFEKMEKPLYATKRVGGSNVEIIIPDVQIDNFGKDIKHADFGIISGISKIMFDGEGKYKITITKLKPVLTASGNVSIWRIIAAEKKVQKQQQPDKVGANKNPPNLQKEEVRVGERISRNMQRNSDLPNMAKTRTRSLFDSDSKKRENPNRPCLPQSTKKSVEQSSIKRARSQSRPRQVTKYYEDDGVNIRKQAIVTNVLENPKSAICFLWLLEDHECSLIRTQLPVPPVLKQGCFFEGFFKKETSPGFRYIGVQFIKPICFPEVTPKVLDGRLNIHLKVYNYNRNNRTIKHDLFGEIATRNQTRSFNYTKGLFVSIFIDRKNEWKIAEVISAREQLIEEFRNAWQIPIIKKYTELVDDGTIYDFLKNYYDILKSSS